MWKHRPPTIRSKQACQPSKTSMRGPRTVRSSSPPPVRILVLVASRSQGAGSKPPSTSVWIRSAFFYPWSRSSLSHDHARTLQGLPLMTMNPFLRTCPACCGMVKDAPESADSKVVSWWSAIAAAVACHVRKRRRPRADGRPHTCDTVRLAAATPLPLLSRPTSTTRSKRRREKRIPIPLWERGSEGEEREGARASTVVDATREGEVEGVRVRRRHVEEAGSGEKERWRQSGSSEAPHPTPTHSTQRVLDWKQPTERIDARQ